MKDLAELHKLSFKNKHKVEKSDEAGCFYCLEVFKGTDVDQWVDDGETATCPNCGIDSVVPISQEYGVEEGDLKRLKEGYF